MKPAPQISSNYQSLHGDGRCLHRNFPSPDHAYQSTLSSTERSTSAVESEAYAPQAWSMWKVSSEYFAREAIGEYAIEAILFAWMSAVAAWPIAVAIHQLTRWVI